jgi:TonB family protein
MPNITSYSGSWLMWYASHTMSGIQQAPISPPVPRRKVDPKYIATAAEERIEGRVQLMCVINGAGKVDHVELLRGIDDRLNQSAMDALGKWEFAPATRGGVPVDVDVMVEIPFKLAPKVPAP